MDYKEVYIWYALHTTLSNSSGSKPPCQVATSQTGLDCSDTLVIASAIIFVAVTISYYHSLYNCNVNLMRQLDSLHYTTLFIGSSF